MAADPNPPAKNEPAPDVKLQPAEHEQETTPAQERGERYDQAKAVARGGKDAGHVPGAEPA
ncbi:hypothetical protein [Urbifossiella limnaea]|uniref:Uncharacterized protein n=1 Tax=Urbifossiella limnaea TaxID=2528023 RepID=A0A517Y0A1_9BACT|nr:hypothetical protein [Urbifossiella limnaea]QDU23179.1 hypothetical protein ETAA1_51710 [Urbifossiella limnaea]